nr:AAA ATPase, putative [Tanacetum cinerariifolium]
FIYTNELPPLLKAAAREGTIILPLLLSTSMFSLTPLSEFQSVNGSEQPLDLLTDGQVNQTLFQVAKQVHEIFTTPAKKSVTKPVVTSVSARKPSKTTSSPPELTAKNQPVTSRSAKKEPAKPKSSPNGANEQQALLVKRNGEWEAIPVTHSKIGQQLELALRPATPAQVAFLSTLRQSRDGLASVVFRWHSYRCTLQELNAVTENRRETWHLTADTQELNARTEVTYSSLTPDMQAQARAELLLLNTAPPEQSPMRWLAVGNLGDATASPLPALYQQVGRSPARFRQGQSVLVDFEGQREAAHREAPGLIHVKGTCALPDSAKNSVLLGPISHLPEQRHRPLSAHRERVAVDSQPVTGTGRLPPNTVGHGYYSLYCSAFPRRPGQVHGRHPRGGRPPHAGARLDAGALPAGRGYSPAQPTVDALIYRAANNYYRHQRDVVGFANLDYDIGVTIHEALNLSSGLDLCYDRPTIGFTYSLWYHARRVNTFLRYFLRELASTSAASLDVFDLGAGTGAVQWAVGLAFAGLRACGRPTPQLNIINVDSSPFMLEYNRAYLWPQFLLEYPTCQEISCSFNVNSWSTPAEGSGAQAWVAAFDFAATTPAAIRALQLYVSPLVHLRGIAREVQHAHQLPDDGPHAKVLNADFLLEEFHRVVYGLGYLTADDYLTQPRTGRGAKISHRPLVWQCFERYFEQLALGQSFTNRRLTFLRGLRDGTIQHKFDHIFVDEYQDCTPADLEIFRHLLHDPDCIVLAGDLAQAVQIGRTSAAEKRFRHFMGLKQDRRNLHLQGSYRLPFRISEAIREVSEQINTLYKGDRDAGVIAPYKGSPPGARPVLVYGESVAELAAKVSEILRAFAPFALREVTILEKDVALASCLQPQVAIEVETDTILKLKGLEKTCIIWSTATSIEHRGEVFEFIYTILTRTSCLLIITLTPATQELSRRALPQLYRRKWKQKKRNAYWLSNEALLTLAGTMLPLLHLVDQAATVRSLYQELLVLLTDDQALKQLNIWATPGNLSWNAFGQNQSSATVVQLNFQDYDLAPRRWGAAFALDRAVNGSRSRTPDAPLSTGSVIGRRSETLVTPAGMNEPRTDIFISYSHSDKAWVERLQTHLKPLARDLGIQVWSDSKLRVGDNWREELKQALDKTRVAILLVSPQFLASDFILASELPRHLEASAKEGVVILPLLVSSSAFALTSLSRFQAINAPDQPLDLLPEGQVNQILSQVAARAYNILATPRKKKSPPPAYFLGLSLENTRSFGRPQHISFACADDPGRPAQWTIILGDNGIGKTTLLKALASLCTVEEKYVTESGLLKGFRNPRFSIDFEAHNRLASWSVLRRSGKPVAALKGDVVSGAKLASFSLLESRSTQQHLATTLRVTEREIGISVPEFRTQGLVCYAYGAGRTAGTLTFSEAQKNADTSYSLFNDQANLLNPEDWFIQFYVNASLKPNNKTALSYYERVKSALLHVLPEIREIKLASAGRPESPHQELQMLGPYGWVRLAEMSLGYQIQTGWLTDLASKLFERYPNSKNPLAEPAIVLVDEIDLHLHPAWQRKLIDFLSNTFPNTQFIVTAHSPLVIQSASDAGANIVLLEREANEVVVRSDLPSVRGWRLDQIMTSDLFKQRTARSVETEEWLQRRIALTEREETLTPDEQAELRALNARTHAQPGAVMIRIQKSAHIPDKLTTTGATHRTEMERAYDQDPAACLAPKSTLIEAQQGTYGHRTVKQALKDDQYDKCCYCERDFTANYHGDVEHFRPKGGYQQTHKGNYFPLVNHPAGRADGHIRDTTIEQALLIDLASENPENHLTFKHDVVKARKIKGRQQLLNDCTLASFDFSGIDAGDPESQRLILRLVRLHETVDEFIKRVKKARLRVALAAQDSAEFAGMGPKPVAIRQRGAGEIERPAHIRRVRLHLLASRFYANGRKSKEGFSAVLMSPSAFQIRPLVAHTPATLPTAVALIGRLAGPLPGCPTGRSTFGGGPHRNNCPAGLVSLTDAINTTSAKGCLVFNLFASLAEFKRELIRERTHAGLASARARGRVGGRQQGLSEEAERTVIIAEILYREQQLGVNEIAQRLRISKVNL